MPCILIEVHRISDDNNKPLKKHSSEICSIILAYFSSIKRETNTHSGDNFPFAYFVGAALIMEEYTELYGLYNQNNKSLVVYNLSRTYIRQLNKRKKKEHTDE